MHRLSIRSTDRPRLLRFEAVRPAKLVARIGLSIDCQGTLHDFCPIRMRERRAGEPELVCACRCHKDDSIAIEARKPKRV